MEKKFLVWGLIFGLLSVIIGAFGAHALKPHLTLEQQISFETGLKYQIYHALVLLIFSQIPVLRTRFVFYLLTLGILLFSFSIYLLNTGNLIGFENTKILGPITPIGGILLISAWIVSIFNAFKLKSR